MIGDFLKAFSLIRAGSRKGFNLLLFQNCCIALTIAVQGFCLYEVNILLKSPASSDDTLVYTLSAYAGLYVLSSIGYLFFLNKTFVNLSNVFESITARCFSSHLGKPYGEILETNNSSVISLFTNDSLRLLANIFLPVSLVVSNILLIGIYIAILGLINLALTIVGLFLGAAVYLIVVFTLRNKLHENSSLINAATNRISKVISIILRGALEIKFYSLENRQLNFFSRASHALASKVTLNNFLSQIPKNLVDIILFLGLASVVVLMRNGDVVHLDFPDLAIFALAASKLLPAAQSLYHSLSAVSGNIDVIGQFSLKDGPVLPNDRSDAVVLERGSCIDLVKKNGGDARFSRLSFDSLRFEVGKNYILHGESGIGKSSIFLLLTGLIGTNSFEILVNASPVRPDQIANNFLFSIDSDLFFEGSVVENIDFFAGTNNVDKTRSSALRLVGMDFIDDGSLDVKILDDGRNFSKGQRQRLSLARVLVARQRRILLFDESLTGLSMNHEREIYLRVFKEFDTVISVSHRKDNDDIFDHAYDL